VPALVGEVAVQGEQLVDGEMLIGYASTCAPGPDSLQEQVRELFSARFRCENKVRTTLAASPPNSTANFGRPRA
jgi:hypothetical protein